MLLEAYYIIARQYAIICAIGKMNLPKLSSINTFRAQTQMLDSQIFTTITNRFLQNEGQ